MPNCQTYESKDADKMVLFITGIKIIDVETLKIVSVYIGDHSEQLENHIAAKLLNLGKTQTESFAPLATRAEQNSRFLVYLCLATYLVLFSSLRLILTCLGLRL